MSTLILLLQCLSMIRNAPSGIKTFLLKVSPTTLTHHSYISSIGTQKASVFGRKEWMNANALITTHGLA
uniref:Putative secreted peptide n=1 Tax=Anopheles braziliensis TaxID=58242 RepID=A0A2M3ZN58_9DIPT